MNNIYKYDRTMVYSSLYILIPAYYVRYNHLKIIMWLQTLFSILHWKYYYNRIFHSMDTILSTYTFIYHLILLESIEVYYRNMALLFALLAVIVFYNRKGYREIALQRYRVIYIIPHALFRYFSFCFVMYVNKCKLSIELSSIYWLNIICMAYF